MPDAKVIHYSTVEAKPIGDSAPGSTIRWLISRDQDGARSFSLRFVEMQPGANSLKHSHEYEHENYIADGEGKVWLADHWQLIRAGDAVYIPSFMEHTFINTGETILRMVCAATV